MHDAPLQRDADGVGTAAGPEFLENMPHVDLHGAFGGSQHDGDLLIDLSGHHQLHDLGFASGEPRVAESGRQAYRDTVNTPGAD